MLFDEHTVYGGAATVFVKGGQCTTGTFERGSNGPFSQCILRMPQPVGTHFCAILPSFLSISRGDVQDLVLQVMVTHSRTMLGEGGVAHESET